MTNTIESTEFSTVTSLRALFHMASLSLLGQQINRMVLHVAFSRIYGHRLKQSGHYRGSHSDGLVSLGARKISYRRIVNKKF